MYKEFWLYIHHLSFLRTVNLLFCRLGYFLSKVFQKPIVFANPYSVSIEPTNRCNLSCPECPTGIKKLGRSVGDIPLNRFKTIVDQIYKKSIVLLLHFQGEPLLNPNIIEMVGYATRRKLITEMSTNATLINSSIAYDLVKNGLKKLVVTIDSPIEKEYGFYRKGSTFAEVIGGINHIQEAKSKLKVKYPLIVIEMLVFKNNINYINQFKELGKRVKADVVRLKTAQIISEEPQVIDNIPFGTRYSRYNLINSNTFVPVNQKQKSCFVPWSKVTVTHDGVVVPCCFDKSASYAMGNVDESTLDQIWRSLKYKRFRNSLLANRNDVSLCSECLYGRMKLDYVIG